MPETVLHRSILPQGLIFIADSAEWLARMHANDLGWNRSSDGRWRNPDQDGEYLRASEIPLVRTFVVQAE